MKTRYALVLAGALLSPLALAEGMGMKGDMMMKHGCDELEECFVEGLNLSNDQQQKIRDILENARKKREDLRNDTVDKIKGVLNTDQQKKLEAHRAEIMQWRAQHMREKAGEMDTRAREMQKQDSMKK